MDLKQLSAPFPKDAVHWRVQGTPFERNGTFSAMALAYLDARDVMDKLDLVCGPENWQDEYTVTANGLTICRIGIRIGDEWVWKSDGAGETAVEGKKGGISDALKRAAVHWGIGRYLYRLDSPFVRCVVKQKNGKTYFSKWDEDPWLKVKELPYHAAEKEKTKVETEGDPHILEAISAAKTADDLKAHWDGNAAYQEYTWFRQAINQRKAKLQQKEAA